MSRYEYSLSGRDFITDDRAVKLVNESASAGLMRGNVLQADWCDLTGTGNIFMSMRNVSCRVRFKELSRDEFLGWLMIITATSSRNDGQALYMMMLGFDEIDNNNYDLFS